jgi:hypothetical protein
VVHGREPPTLLKYQPGSSKVAAVDMQLRDSDEFLLQIREWLLLSQDVMKQQHNKKDRALEFSIGDWAWLRLHHWSAVGITPLKPTKLSPRFYGPYKITEHIGETAYRLQLPVKARIHDVFHVALLKKFEGIPPDEVVLLPQSYKMAESYLLQRKLFEQG